MDGGTQHMTRPARGWLSWSNSKAPEKILPGMMRGNTAKYGRDFENLEPKEVHKKPEEARQHGTQHSPQPTLVVAVITKSNILRPGLQF
jgi:hypothetical protein